MSVNRKTTGAAGRQTPLFGPRGPQVTLAWLAWVGGPPRAHDEQAAHDRLRSLGLHPLPADALQWRGAPNLPQLSDRPDLAQPVRHDSTLWSLVRESDFAAFWADALPALRAAGWSVDVQPGFAHAAAEVEQWRLCVAPLTAPHGLGSWLLSLGVDINGETLDLVPLMARLVKHDRRWLDAAALRAIADDALIRLHAPGGRLIDAPAAPLKAIARALLDLITDPRRRAGPITLAGWEAQRLQQLRRELQGSLASHPSAQRDWALMGEAGLALLAQRLALAGPLQSAEPPAGLGITLRPYQCLGLAWLQTLRAQALGGILADDMGLGKTAQALAHLLLEKQAGRLDRPALVVAPASLLANWQAECARITPTLRLLVLAGPRRSGDHARIAQHDLVLTSYPLLWRDAMALQRQPWHLVVLDEAQMVKNAGSRTASAARRLNARHRLALTGTPVENHLGELWAQFHFLMPGFLGDARAFQRNWRGPIEKNGETQRAQLLAQRVRPFILRRHKHQVATELPPLTEQTIRLRLDGPQHALYESVRLACDNNVRALIDLMTRHSDNPGLQLSVLDALLKLRQVCCDPRLVKGSSGAAVPDAPTHQSPNLPPDGHSAKLDWLRSTLPQLAAQGRRTIVFSQFTEWLRLLMPELDALRLPWLALTGDTPTAQRGAVVAAFQTGDVSVLLASLKAGGTGLNLTAADCVVLLDPWWNPAVEAQAAARAHRIGQTRPVWVARLVVDGSIEDRMLALQARKAQLADAVLGGGLADSDGASEAVARFSAQELAGLLAPLGG
jgi:superfamily II DNA or RNA helicase